MSITPDAQTGDDFDHVDQSFGKSMRTILRDSFYSTICHSIPVLQPVPVVFTYRSPSST